MPDKHCVSCLMISLWVGGGGGGGEAGAAKGLGIFPAT